MNGTESRAKLRDRIVRLEAELDGRSTMFTQHPVPGFDPLRDCRYRGKRLDDLSKEELLAALVQSLHEVHALKKER